MTPEKNPWDAETVYALLQHVDEATYVRGIFSTKEKAQRAQNDLTGESKYEDDLIQKRLPSRRALVREAGVPRKDGNYPETLSSIIHDTLPQRRLPPSASSDVYRRAGDWNRCPKSVQVQLATQGGRE
ncbi:MAG TPA: hypothetical protein VGG32_11365 [Thermoplasmata archaeon]|jgi:hypothetical protein